MRRKKWLAAKCDKELAAQISQELGIDPLTALLAVSRGMDTADEIYDFLDPEAPLSLSPLSIADMSRAAERINRAVENFELICIFGDYDADGVASTALLYSYLETRGANVIRYVPDRISEGYGLNAAAIEKLAGEGVKLIATVDNGINAVEEAARAKELGIDLVITDHHKAGDVLPDAYAVVDPKRPDCPSVYKDAPGAGVAFELVCALEGDDGNILIEEYGDLAAIGAIGDSSPLTRENRIMVRRGLKLMNENPRPGIKALMKVSGSPEKTISSSTAAFTLCPRINAAGRTGSAQKALELLLCEDEEKAAWLAEEINEANVLRRRAESEIFYRATRAIDSDPEKASGRIIVIDGEEWNAGVIGIVASRLVERYGRPAAVISRSGRKARGSCRSPEGFSIYDALKAVSDVFERFGGHALAAGFSLDSSRIAEFEKRINEYAADKEIPPAVERIDCRLLPSSISLDLVGAVDLLEPFGAGNPQPLFGLFKVKIEETASVSDGKHMRMIVSKNGSRIGAIRFGTPEKRFPFEIGDVVDLAVNLEKNYFNGGERVSVVVREMRPSFTDEDKVLLNERLFEKFARKEKLTSEQAEKLLPDRRLQENVFRSVRARPLKDKYYEALCVRLGDDGENLARIIVAVQSMLETGVLAADEDDAIFVPDSPPKVNLEDSAVMKRIRAFL